MSDEKTSSYSCSMSRWSARATSAGAVARELLGRRLVRADAHELGLHADFLSRRAVVLVCVRSPAKRMPPAGLMTMRSACEQT